MRAATRKLGGGDPARVDRTSQEPLDLGEGLGILDFDRAAKSPVHDSWF